MEKVCYVWKCLENIFFINEGKSLFVEWLYSILEVMVYLFIKWNCVIIYVFVNKRRKIFGNFNNKL